MIPKGGLKVGMKVRGVYDGEVEFIGIITQQTSTTHARLDMLSRKMIASGKPLFCDIDWNVDYDEKKKRWGADNLRGELFYVNNRLQKIKERLM